MTTPRGKLTVGRKGIDKANALNIYIGRGSALGNPFPMKGESERDKVCDQYAEYFYEKVKKNGALKNEVIRIFRLLRSGNNVNIQCFCAPRRCHGDTIKQFIEQHLNKSGEK